MADELKASKQRYDLLVNLSPVGIIVSCSNKVVFANPTALSLWGASQPGDIIGKSPLDRVHPGDRERIKREISTLKKKRSATVIMEVRCLRMDGSLLHVEGRGTLIRYNGRTCIQTIFTDITARKNAEAIQQREIDFAYNLVQAIPAYFSAISNDNRIILMNAAMLGALGYRLEEVVGADFLNLFVPATERKEVARHFHSLRNTKEPLLSESALLTRDGRELVVEWHGRPVLKDNGEVDYFFIVGIDVTERRRSAEEHKRMEIQIQRTQKLESLGVLAGGIAHDFNNILVNILGNADLLLLELPPDSPLKPRIEDIKKAGLRASELSNQMLAYSGKGRFLIQRHNLNKLVEDMVNLLKVSVSKKATVEYHFAKDLPCIEADSAQIRQVIMNLITNASEALAERDGLIRISTGTIRADSQYLADTFLHDNLVPGLYVYVEITDNGCGMDTQTKARLFDPFFTTKFIGRGLGLAAVLGIVRGHNGAIKLWSEPGKGTTFRVLFPCSDMTVEVEPDAEAGGDASEAWTGSGTLLVVDDEEGVRNVVQMMLERSGFTVLTAADGLEAISLFEKHADEIRAVILDLSMPHMNGGEVFLELRGIRPGVRVILASGYTAEHARSHFQDMGPAGFIQKPFVIQTLLEAIQAALKN